MYLFIEAQMCTAQMYAAQSYCTPIQCRDSVLKCAVNETPLCCASGVLLYPACFCIMYRLTHFNLCMHAPARLAVLTSLIVHSTPVLADKILVFVEFIQEFAYCLLLHTIPLGSMMDGPCMAACNLLKLSITCLPFENFIFILS